MKILLFRPAPSPETIGLQHVMVVEPLELEVMGACAGADDQVEIVDLILERRPAEHFLQRARPDLVGVTGYITNVPAMIDLCRRAKRIDPRVRTVVGGVHCEVCPDHLDDPAVDFRVVRNAGVVFGALLAHLRGRGPLPPGVLTPGDAVAADRLPAFDFRAPLPDRGLTRRYRRDYFYIFHDRVALLKTAYGCPFRCTFCFCRAITQNRYHPRPFDDVMDELEAIEEREVYIVDDDFFVSAERMREFIAAVRARGIRKRYLVYGRADFVARHPDLMAELKTVGLRTVIIGFESFRDEDLDAYDKRVDVATNAAAMRVCRELGVDVYATIVVAPDWTREDFARHAEIFRELDMNYINLQPLTPLPGTGVEAPARDLLLASGDFERWDLAHVSIRPKHMSVADFYREMIGLYTRTLYRPRYLRRYLGYSPRLLRKMIAGSLQVRAQYRRKLREARRFG